MKKIKVLGSEKIDIIDDYKELFFILNNIRPNVICVDDLECGDKRSKTFKKLKNIEHKNFQDYIYYENNSNKRKNIIKEIYVEFNDKLFIQTSKRGFGMVEIIYHPDITDMKLFNKILNILLNGRVIRETKASGNINLLLKNKDGFYTKQFKVNVNKIDIDLNYNDDFKEINDIIINKLNEYDEKGIVMLHGIPGTGKTSYLRYLTTIIKKDIIYLSPDMTTHLSSPDLIPFLLSYPNSVLVIEDSENVISKRKGQDNQSVSNLLNMGDGLLSDCIKMQIICTFNCDINEVDDALIRKGRLIAKYEFKPLTVEKSNKLLKSLDVDFEVNEEKKLSDLYNLDKRDFKKEKQKIGFVFEKSKNEPIQERKSN